MAHIGNPPCDIGVIRSRRTEGDKVMSRLSISGAHDQEIFAGIPPTGVKLEFTGIIINRVVDGKIAEEWSEGTYAYELTQQRLDHEVRGRVDQELRVARRIRQALLPKELLMLDDWEIAPYYQPAREVGGDFYDFLPLPDGRVGVIIGDVSGKGIAAALVMANTQSVLRAVSQGNDRSPQPRAGDVGLAPPQGPRSRTRVRCRAPHRGRARSVGTFHRRGSRRTILPW